MRLFDGPQGLKPDSRAAFSARLPLLPQGKKSCPDERYLRDDCQSWVSHGLHVVTLDTQGHRALDQLNGDNQARIGIAPQQDSFDSIERTPADSHTGSLTYENVRPHGDGVLHEPLHHFHLPVWNRLGPPWQANEMKDSRNSEHGGANRTINASV